MVCGVAAGAAVLIEVHVRSYMPLSCLRHYHLLSVAVSFRYS